MPDMGPKTGINDLFKCSDVSRFALQHEILKAIGNGCSFVGINQNDGKPEAIFRTEKGAYVGISRSVFSYCSEAVTTKYLANPLERQPSLFWRGSKESCTVDTLAADTSPTYDVLKCIGRDAAKTVTSLIEMLKDGPIVEIDKPSETVNELVELLRITKKEFGE